MQRRTFITLAIQAAAGMVLAACGLEGRSPTPMPSPESNTPAASTPSAGPTLGPIAQPTPVAFPYAPLRVNVKPSLASYTFAPDAAVDPDVVRELSDAQKALLTSNGFVVVANGSPQIYQIYQQGKDRNAPLFVTTDSVLHAYHVLYDFTLRSVEIDHLLGMTRDLTATMLVASEAQYRAAHGTAQASAKANTAFFAVAAKLLDPAAAVPAEASDLVSSELKLIDGHEGYASSPIFGYKEDYSQYVPRGHYTRNDQFKMYFRAMMWYGRMGFRLKPGTTIEAVNLGREETRRALLIVSGLQQSSVGQDPALKAWDRIYGPTAFFVGTSDDLTVYDYQAVAAAVYGQTPTVTELDDTAKLDAFIAAAMTLRSPRIVSSYVTDQEKAEEVTKSFRFIGQRFIPDSYIFQQLVYNKVGTQGKPRLFPKGLDILAVFGSQRAYDLLDKVYKETAYEKYADQVKKLKTEFSSLPAGDWTQNLYWSWLYSLLPLTRVKGEGYPSFMQTEAWTDKQMSAALGSWAELRHDTILYAKQSTTIRATAMMPQPEAPKGYVEPEPEVYARLAALSAQTRNGLQERGLLSGEYAGKLAGFEQFLLNLKTIAEKELANQALADSEYELIRNVGGFLESVTTFTAQEQGKLSSDTDKLMAVAADVHTDTNSKQVLEEAVGDAFPIYVLVPVEGKLTLTKGGVFSYYEFTVPLAQRLTDEQWQKMSPRPDQPVWTQSFVR